MNMANYVLLAIVIFSIGLFGVLVRKNFFFVLMSVELMLNASNLLFVTFAKSLGDANGHVLAFFVMAIAAAEACVGLSIIILYFRKKKGVNISEAALMKH
jgi:NADH-quinone oxidoreductase subunit K